jgi:hypothetical protein
MTTSKNSKLAEMEHLRIKISIDGKANRVAGCLNNTYYVYGKTNTYQEQNLQERRQTNNDINS